MIRSIFFDILGPILALVLLGAIMRRRFKIDIGTLSKLNIYLFTPAFLFSEVSHSVLSWSAMGGVVTITFLQVATLGALVWGIGRAVGISRKTLAAIAMAVMFYNSANYGLPLASLAFPREGGRDGGAVQAFVVFSQNVLTYTVGLSIAAWAGSGNLRGATGAFFRLPVAPTLACALLARWWIQSGHHLPIVIDKSAGYLANGLVPTALLTVGAQMAVKPRWPRWKPISMVLILRLIFGPIQMAALLYALHLTGWKPVDLWTWPAEALILTAAVPTAISTLLLTLEVGGDADLAADCVFWTTLFSCVTITRWLVILRLTMG